MTNKEAKTLAASLGIRGRSKMNAAELKEAVDHVLGPIRRARRSRVVRRNRRARIARRGY